MGKKLQDASTMAYLRRGMSDSPDYHPPKAAKIYQRFETPIKKSFEEMEETKPSWRKPKPQMKSGGLTKKKHANW
jgi:hypothetical protein